MGENFDRYYIFRKLLDFVADNWEVTDADMNNYVHEIEITGKADDGSTITIKVELKEANADA